MVQEAVFVVSNICEYGLLEKKLPIKTLCVRNMKEKNL